jgi:hypothetical protein
VVKPPPAPSQEPAPGNSTRSSFADHHLGRSAFEADDPQAGVRNNKLREMVAQRGIGF